MVSGSPGLSDSKRCFRDEQHFSQAEAGTSLLQAVIAHLVESHGHLAHFCDRFLSVGAGKNANTAFFPVIRRRGVPANLIANFKDALHLMISRLVSW